MVDYDYARTLNLKLVAGRYFSKEISTDKKKPSSLMKQQ
jgi:hypothetical protein